MKKTDDSNLILWVLIIGTPVYLLMERPVIFWLVFVPIATLVIIKVLMWLKK